jgi:2-polyprenyl-3-methyl-5-hydroxy-6-metoxy-1,4-benzoquinol methylase
MKLILKTFKNILSMQRYKKIILWYLFRKKVNNRNQWNRENNFLWDTYNKLMSYSWDETKTNPQYFKRLNFVVEKCEGRVLEIGCGIGTMTKWISKSDRVKEVIAIDAFPEAIEELKKYNFSKVKPLQMYLENIKFEDAQIFNTVVISEIIEHIYPDEEEKMLKGLRPYINSTTSYIISTPIGWMPDPYHIRFFSKKRFKTHLEKYYGEPMEIDCLLDYSQSAFGYFNP